MTYSVFDYDALPPIERRLDDSLTWLLEQPRVGDWSILGQTEPQQFESIRSQAAATLGPRIPAAFASFIESMEPGTRVRSATACFVEFGDFVAPVAGGGSLIHFLSDQQWVCHWFLYVGEDGEEAVISAYPPYGFELGDEFFDDGAYDPGFTKATLRRFDSTADKDAVVCAASFSEFLYRFWIENEIYFRLKDNSLTPEQRRYLNHYGQSEG